MSKLELIQAPDKFNMEPWQLEDIEYMETVPNPANWSDMGCISGDAIVHINRAGKGTTCTLKQAYESFHGLSKHAKRYDPNIPTYAQAYVNGRIRKHLVEDIIDKGERETIQVRLVDGRTIVATLDHWFLTSTGKWKDAQDLTPDDYVVVKGGFSSAQEPRVFPRNVSLQDGRFIDKDGYVRIYKADHPRANATGHVYEHIVVMEDFIGRKILKDEHVHHIDEIPSNNNLDNLELTSPHLHHRYHAKKRLGTWSTSTVQVQAVVSAGTNHVYDIVMAAPFHNFIANGIVVHNTYKTSTGLWLFDRRVKDAGNVLIVTTKAGKGAYFSGVPRALDESWRVFNINTKEVEEIVLGNIALEFDLEEFIWLLKQGKQKIMVLAHYHCFIRASIMGEILIGGSETGKIQWDVIAVDEAHKMKSKDTQWTRGIKRMAHARKQERIMRHLMTGTGIVNNPAEAYSLFNFLEPDRFSSYHRFRKRYCDIENWNGFDTIVGVLNEEEFVSIRKGFGPRRTMREVHKDIGEPIYAEIEVELNPTQRRMYREIVKDLMMLDQQGFEIHSPNVVSQLGRLRQISVATPQLDSVYFDDVKQKRVQEITLVEPSSKLDALMELLEGLKWDDEDKQQVVVFSSFKGPLELLKKRLEAQYDKNGRLTRKEIPYIHMEAKDSDTTRFDKWHNQFPKKEHQVFLSTIALGGESINLACAQYCVFLDRSWSPAQNSQAVGRVYRPGQTGIAEIIHINAKNTVDRKVYDNVTLKNEWFNQLFNDDETM